jgi:hypothetical protein
MGPVLDPRESPLAPPPFQISPGVPIVLLEMCPLGIMLASLHSPVLRLEITTKGL